MVKNLSSQKTWPVILVALVAGFVSAKYMVQGSPVVSIPWGILAFCTAFFARSKREALAMGGLMGFAASYGYLWFDNTSHLTPGKVIVLTFLIAIPALLGLLCGLLAAWLGWIIRRRFVQ